jgi:hypothetical protein
MPHLFFWITSTWVLGVFGGGDTDRLMYYAFPAELILLCHVFRSVGVQPDRAWAPFLLTMSVGQIAISQSFAQEVMASNVFVFWNARVLGAWVLVLLILLPGRLRVTKMSVDHLQLRHRKRRKPQAAARLI